MKTEKIRTALIVGGGSGMGQSAAMALSRMGIQVFVADLDLAAAQKTLSMIEAPEARGEAFFAGYFQKRCRGGPL